MSEYAAPRSLGYATDLALLRQQGARVEPRAGYLVVRSPANPTFHWGNCLILDAPPAPGTLHEWLDVFRRELPGADHVAIGIDTAAEPACAEPACAEPTCAGAIDAAEAAALGLAVERDLVLTSAAPGQASAPEGVRLVQVAADDDAAWDRLVEAEMSDEIVGTPASHRLFLQRRYAGHRAAVRAGHGTWCAAILPDGTPVATLGVFDAGDGLARYQSVFTHPEHRRRGLAAALVGFAGAYAVSALGARTLVIVADPEGPAIGVYRRAGFADREAQDALYRASS